MYNKARFASFHELPLTQISPEGWLRRYLEKQRDGLTGHLEAAGYPFNTYGWGGKRVPKRDGEDWWAYEQTGYWVDGMIRCGHLLGDEFLISKARKQIEYVLEHPDFDGYLGPKHIKEPQNHNRWAHAVFFRALMAEQSATKDARISWAVRRHYLSRTSPHSFGREVCNVEAICWAYTQTGNKRLLEHALQGYDEFNRKYPDRDNSVRSMLSGRRATEHGVTYNEMAKLPAILYMHTGNRRLLRASINAYRKIDRDSMLIDGVCSSTEDLQGKDPLDSHETCDIADYTWSVGYLLLATGDPAYADKIERACFNAAPGAVDSDFKALQYFSCPNQVIATSRSNHNLYERGKSWMSYRPNPGTQCCAGEVNRIMPNFISRMWLSDGKGGLVAAMYGPSRVTAKVGPTARKVTIVEETNYPFSEEISLQIRTGEPVRFTLWVRIPTWARGARIMVNGKKLKGPTRAGTFRKITRRFAHNDRITLVLPMKVKLTHTPRGGVGIERGPLVYSLGIPAQRRIDRRDKCSTADLPAYDLYPVSRWNYALGINEQNLRSAVEIIKNPVSLDPWSLEESPVELRVPARIVKGWGLVRKRAVTRQMSHRKLEKARGDFQFTPQLPNPAALRSKLGKKLQTVTLVPYGCTQLRMTIFPQCS